MNGAWGTLAVGLFAKSKVDDIEFNGLLYGGGMYKLGVQALAVVTIATWSLVTTYLLLWVRFFYRELCSKVLKEAFLLLLQGVD